MLQKYTRKQRNNSLSKQHKSLLSSTKKLTQSKNFSNFSDSVFKSPTFYTDRSSKEATHLRPTAVVRCEELDVEADPAVVGDVGPRGVDGPAVMERRLAGLECRRDGGGRVDLVDLLAEQQHVVGVVGRPVLDSAGQV